MDAHQFISQPRMQKARELGRLNLELVRVTMEG